jgi:hypothetical protein
LIRFKNSAATLPAVVAALDRQTLHPNLILGVDTGSTDGSSALLKSAGAQVIEWSAPYHHSKVLNFGLAQCPAARVLILSSHTVLESTDALARLNAALDNPQTACASGKWDDDPYYTDSIDWNELHAKGLKLGSIYSNSFGLLRRSLWEEQPFDESLPTMEDYAWAVDQVRRGHLCKRVPFNFSYQRQAEPRDFLFTACAFRLAARQQLPVRWLGRKQTLLAYLRLIKSPAHTPEERTLRQMHSSRLLASLVWPFVH